MASHECICQTTTRRMGLVLGNLCEEYDEIATMVERFGVDWDTELATVVFEVGPDTAFAGPAEVLDLLTGIIGPENVGRVRATWLGREPLASQLQILMRAESLTGFAPARTSPLAGILERREITTWFQPILDRAGSVWGYECLMRAFTAEGETISPGQLIAWARQENLLFMLDRVCRETHIASAAAAAADEDIHFLINFLPSVIYRPEFCLRTTVAALKGTHLLPERVIFEVVETEEVEDHTHLREILQYYRDAGFKFALDDMGAGYSGLTLLADLDPDLVKIDRQLVRRAVDSPGHAEICRAIVDLGQRQAKQVLAEGVETEQEYALMQSLGADLYQGYLFGRPAPLPKR